MAKRTSKRKTTNVQTDNSISAKRYRYNRRYTGSYKIPEIKTTTREGIRNTTKVIVSPRRHPKQQSQVETVSGKRGTIRVTTDLTKCRTRKNYKKKMLKAIAAQMKRSGKGLSSWRRRRRQSTNIIYRC